MTENLERDGHPDRCLKDEDIYFYIAESAAHPDQERIRRLEKHLAHCLRCREELAGVLMLLHPEDDETSAPEPPLEQHEIERTLDLIHGVARQEKRQHSWRISWIAAAAAAAALLGAGLAAFWYFSRPDPFFMQAKAKFEETYTGKSPGGLRLDLPFQPAAALRAEASTTLEQAKILFSQAIAVRRTPEAHLGLAAVLLGESRFSEARAQFEEVLKISRDHFQGLLGRGVAAYEEGRQAEDPVARLNLLSGALRDFDAAMKQQPESAAARYNRIWVLYETGRHKEALAEIDMYLARDSTSLWAVELKDLKIQIQFNRPEPVNIAVRQAARSRDQAALAAMARLVPEQIPPAIRLALKTSLRPEGGPEGRDAASPEDLRWAAGIMESAYGAAISDHSWKALLQFYDSLSPAEREFKRMLNDRFDRAQEDLHQKRLESALRAGASLEPGYAKIKDHWQLFNIHHLRGNCFIYLADFPRAESEYRKMLRYAELTEAPELRAKALGALFSALNSQVKPDEVEYRLGELRRVAEEYHLDSWSAFAAQATASFYWRLSQWDLCVKNLTIALGYACRNRDFMMLAGLMEKLFLIMDRRGRAEDARLLGAEAVKVMTELDAEEGRLKKTEVDTAMMNLLCTQGEYSLSLGDLDSAESVYRKVLAAVPQGQLREIECRGRIGLAQVCIAKNRLEEARLLLEQSLASAAARQYADLEWQAGFLMGRVYRRMGDAAAARDALLKSVAALEKLRGSIVSLDLRQQFLERRYDPYREIVSLFHNDLHDSARTREFAGRAKSMLLREYLTLEEDDSLSGTEAIDPALRAVAVDYFFTERDLLAIVAWPGHDEIIQLRVSRQQIGKMVQDFLEEIRRNNESAFSSLSKELYDMLLAPVLQRTGTSGCRNMLIFPDGPLHLLPFGGLRDEANRFLLERFALSYAPSRRVLQQCLSWKRGNAASRDRTVLLIGGAANLQGADLELAHLADLYRERAHLMKARDLSSAGRLAADAEIIHFSGHASLIGGKPALLVQAPGGQSRLGFDDIRSWRLRRNRLVVLAGCSTGIGPETEGEIPWGLIPAFMNAGAPAMIVSLLPVDDAATAGLVTRFYDLLAGDSISKTAALQQAQLSLLASARTQGRLNPASWLPYVLVGDPR